MNNSLATNAHASTMRMDIHEVTRRLVAHLGPTAVSLLAGAKSSKMSSRWAHSDGPVPRTEAQRRLLAAHRAWEQISLAENDYVARNWFIGANPRLDERSPLEVLRDGDDQAVLTAALAFSEGTDG